MANFPVYNFNDPTLDYSEVEVTVDQMYSYLISKTSCCKGKSLTENLCVVNGLMRAIDIDGDINNTDLYNYERYKADVKAAYQLLYILV